MDLEENADVETINEEDFCADYDLVLTSSQFASTPHF
jgi:hypothetical protein